MEQYKKDFIDFMVECQVLRFGDFITKSGREEIYEEIDKILENSR